MRHPQEFRGNEPALARPRVPDELDALARVDEYAIQIEQDGATLHGWNGMNLLAFNEPAFRRPFTGLLRALNGPVLPPNGAEHVRDLPDRRPRPHGVDDRLHQGGCPIPGRAFEIFQRTLHPSPARQGVL